MHIDQKDVGTDRHNFTTVDFQLNVLVYSMQTLQGKRHNLRSDARIGAIKSANLKGT